MRENSNLRRGAGAPTRKTSRKRRHSAVAFRLRPETKSMGAPCSALSGFICMQAKRISGSDALSHPYLDEGRLRYHTCMCQCCYSVPSGRVYTRDFEPVAERPFSHSYENSLLSVWQGKGTPAAP
ncbi:serine/threonine-protein kinase NLK2-like [Neolamprologus brichardi]|uniref:serine/threonine-protein kinase NLK2-like n=1 Tax=Neolamprologus brichardi TaxID=32507 RepID=UPI0003EC64A5|nr:serine/threonine-protein kinase NLK2-like [Neolamprologus brichardi]